MGARPTTEWRNLGDLDQIVTALLASGRALSTVAILEKASGAEHAPWDMADRIATLRLHLGEPARAVQHGRARSGARARDTGSADRNDLPGGK